MSNEYFIMQGLVYADEFSISFLNSLGSTVRTITNENWAEMEIDESLITDLRDDEMVVWDGKADNGNLVASGTYYYVLTYIMNQLNDQGNIEPVRYDFKDYIVVVRE